MASGIGRAGKALAQLVVLLAFGGAFTAGAGAVPIAQTIYPTRYDDPAGPAGTACGTLPLNDTDCSLRNALAMAANGQSVSVAPIQSNGPGPFVVQQTAYLQINHNISVLGAGARTSKIEQTTAGGVLRIMPLTNASVSGVTITGGNAQWPDPGGGIVNEGTLTLTDSAVTGNETSQTAMAPGPAFGGGITSDGTLTIIRSVISDNTANAGSSVAAQGGGLAVQGVATIVDSTIAGNKAQNGAVNRGGGIYVNNANNSGTSIRLANVTLARNSATGSNASAGNLYLPSGALGTAKNTIIAAGTAAAGSENCNAPIISQGSNLEDRDQCALGATGDQVDTSPRLGTLQDNGGPTDTIAPSPDSPAIDRGNPAGCGDFSSLPLTVDQRALPRPQGVACDVGAYELQPLPAALDTARPSPIGPRGAVLRGTVDTHGFRTRWHFDYGSTTAYGSSTATGSVASGSEQVSAPLSGLAPDTTYHFRLRASTPGGASETRDQTFTTAPDRPDVITGAATVVNATTVTVKGQLVPNGLPTSYRFEFGATRAYGKTTAGHAAGSGTIPAAAAATLTGLKRGAVYHYRLVATNSAGNRSGADRHFIVLLAPKLSALRITRRFSVKGPGATIAYRDSDRGSTTFVIKRRLHAHGTKTVGRFTVKSHSGLNHVHFTGRLHGVALGPGRYTITATARSPRGLVSGPVSRRFRITS